MLGAGDLSRQLTNDAAIFSGDQSAIASMTRTQCSVQTIDERACVTGGVNPRMDGEACAGEEKGAAEAPGLFDGMAIQNDGLSVVSSG